MRRILSVLLAAMLLAAPAGWPGTAAAQEDPDAKYKAQWDAVFADIDGVFLTGVGIDLLFSAVPSSELIRKYLTKNAGSVQVVLRGFGIDPAKYQYSQLDGIQVARIGAGLRMAKSFKNTRRKAEILAYSVCPWENESCKADVKAAIYKHRGWAI